MPERLTMPFLRSPEVEREKVPEALEAEQLAYEYVVKEEEVMSILDEFSRTLTLEDLMRAKNYQELPADFRKVIENALANARERDRENNLANDRHFLKARHCLRLWELNPKVFAFAAMGSIKSEQEEVFNKILSEADKEKREDIQKQIEDRTAGLAIRLVDLAKGHLNKNLQDLSKFGRLSPEARRTNIQQILEQSGENQPAFEPEELEKKKKLKKVRTYREDFAQHYAEQEKELQEALGGLEVYKASKYPGAVRTERERGNIYFGGDVEAAKESKAMVSDAFQEIFGHEVTFSAEEKHDEIGNLVDQDFMTAYVNYRQQMEYLHDMMERGQIVETDYIKGIIERAMPSLTKNPPTIVYFHGDFGTGKTALAKHIARTKFNKEALTISGSKYLEPERFTEEFKIAKQAWADFVNDLNKKIGGGGKKVEISEDSSLGDVIKVLLGSKQDFQQSLIEDLLREKYFATLAKGQSFNQAGFDTYMKKNPLSGPELAGVEKQLDILFTNDIQGRYVLGAMYTCMAEGKPLIIDEANAIPPEVLITFNDLLTKKFGEKITTRTDKGEITVKKGFCIIWTGNTGRRYNQARYQDIDPASNSRITPIEMHYLPQSRDISTMDTVLENLNLNKLAEEVSQGLPSHNEALQLVKDSKQRAKSDQIFQVLLLKLMNDRLGCHLLAQAEDPYSTIKDIYRLSMGARLIMDLFEGSAPSGFSLTNIERLIGGSGTTTELSEKLQKSNLTMRELIDNIIGGYINDGGAMDIEYYVFDFIRKSQQKPEEQAILYATLKKAAFFDPAQGWPDYQAMANIQEFKQAMESCDPLELDKYKKIDQNGIYGSLLNTRGAYRLQYFSSFEMLQLLFGYLPPRRQAEYEEIQQSQQEALARFSGEGKEKLSNEQLELIENIRNLQKLILAKEAPIKLKADNLKQYRETAEKLKIFGQTVSRQAEGQEKPVTEKIRAEIFSLEDDEFQARIAEYLQFLRQFMVEVGYLTADSAQAIAGLSTTEQLQAMSAAVTGFTSKKKSKN